MCAPPCPSYMLLPATLPCEIIESREYKTQWRKPTPKRPQGGVRFSKDYRCTLHDIMFRSYKRHPTRRQTLCRHPFFPLRGFSRYDLRGVVVRQVRVGLGFSIGCTLQQSLLCIALVLGDFSAATLCLWFVCDVSRDVRVAEMCRVPAAPAAFIVRSFITSVASQATARA